MGITIPQDCRTPDVIAKKCSLIEGIYYLEMGYVPYDYEIGEDVGDKIVSVKIRESWDYLYNENDIREFIEEDLSGCMKAKFGIEDESYNEKYIGIYTTSLEYFDRWTEDFISKISPCNESVVKYTEERRIKRKLLEEFLPLKKSYDDKLAELTEDVKHELYLLIKSGKISITGVLRYNIKEGGDYENENDLIETDNTHNDREIIEIKDIIYDNIRWEESEIITKSNKYYIGVLISFEDLYNNIPQQLEYEINAKLLGNRIVYNGKHTKKLLKTMTREENLLIGIYSMRSLFVI